MRAGIEAPDFQTELFKKKLREELGRPFAHTDHADIRTANHAHRERRDPSLESDRRDEPGTSATKHNDVLNHEEKSAT